MTIQEKAKIALAARDAGDPRAQLMIMMLGLAVGLSTAECWKRIEGLVK